MNSVQTGSLLISMPFLGDPNFERSVILICEHNEEGSFGLILNQKSSFQINDFELFDDPDFDQEVFLGGPVQHNTVHFIHNLDGLSESQEIRKNILWGGDFEALQEQVNLDYESVEGKIRFYLGYSGWGPEQLQGEIESKSWIVFNDYSTNLFKIKPEELWKTVLKEMGGDYAQFANFPIDPSLN